MKYLYLLLLLVFTGCANCTTTGSSDNPPNIRQMSGAECCPAYCEKLTTLKCKGYFEPITTKLADGGSQVMDCPTFCSYMLSNSIQINACCIKDNLKSCDQIEIICK